MALTSSVKNKIRPEQINYDSPVPSATYALNAGTLQGRTGDGYVPNPNNLPVYSIGSADYLDLNIASSFKGTSSPFAARTFVSYDSSNNKVFGLRTATNHELTALYYFYFNNDITTGTDLTYTSTDIQYKPSFLAANEHIDGILSANEHGFLGRVVTNNSYAVDNRKYYWIHINGSLDADKHTYVNVTSIVASAGLNKSTYSKTSIADYTCIVYSPEVDKFFAFKNDNNTEINPAYFSVYNNDTNLTQATAPAQVCPSLDSLITPAEVGTTDIQVVYYNHRPNLIYKVVGDYVEFKTLIGFRALNSTTLVNDRTLIVNFKYRISTGAITSTALAANLSANISNPPYADTSLFVGRSMIDVLENDFPIGNRSVSIRQAYQHSGYFYVYVYDKTFTQHFDDNFDGIVGDRGTIVISNDSCPIGKALRYISTFQVGGVDIVSCTGLSKSSATATLEQTAFVTGWNSAAPTATYNPTAIEAYGRLWFSTLLDGSAIAAGPKFVTKSNTNGVFDIFNNLADFETDTYTRYGNGSVVPALTILATTAVSGFSNTALTGGNYSGSDIHKVNANILKVEGGQIYYTVAYTVLKPNLKRKTGFFLAQAATGTPQVVSVIANSAVEGYETYTSSYNIYSNDSQATGLTTMYKSVAGDFYICYGGDWTYSTAASYMNFCTVRVNGTTLATTKLADNIFTTNFSTVHSPKLGMHPLFGLHCATSIFDSYLAGDMWYFSVNPTPAAVSDAMRIATFYGPGSGGGQGNLVEQKLENFVTIKSAIGLAVSFSDIEVFMKGRYFVIPTGSITNLAPNTTSYVYVSSNESLYTLPSLLPDTVDDINIGWITTDSISVSNSYFAKRAGVYNKPSGSSNEPGSVFLVLSGALSAGNNVYISSSKAVTGTYEVSPDKKLRITLISGNFPTVYGLSVQSSRPAMDSIATKGPNYFEWTGVDNPAIFDIIVYNIVP